MPPRYVAKQVGVANFGQVPIATDLIFDTNDSQLKYANGTNARAVINAEEAQTISGVKTFTATPVFSGDGGIQYTEVVITSAQIKAIRATPITLVAAPAAGKALRFLGAELLLDYGGTNGFTESTNNLAVRYTNTTGVVVSGTIEMTGFIDQTADIGTGAIPVIDGIVAKAGLDGQALVLHNTSGAEIAGNAGADNVVRVKTWYSVFATGW